MATYYGINAGGNYSAGGTWSTTAAKDATRTGGATQPTAADTIILDDYSGSVTVDTASCLGLSLSCTVNGNYTGTLTFTATKTLTISGNVIFSSTMALAGTGTLVVNNTANLDFGGLTFTGTLNLAFTKTYTLLAAINTTILTGSGAGTNTLTFSGAFGITTGILNFSSGGASSMTLVSGQTLTVSTAMTVSGPPGGTVTIKASIASSDAFLHYNGAAANCKVAGMVFTDINCAHPIDNWYGGTLTRTTGIINRTTADLATAAQAGSIISGTTISLIAGTYHAPEAAEVISTAVFGPSSGTAGTFDEAARNTDPGEANVKTGTGYKIQNIAKNGSYSASGGTFCFID